jgi:hypothetical protein
MISRAAVLSLLAIALTAQAEDYSVHLRFEDGHESSRYSAAIPPNGSLSSSFASTLEARKETFIINVTPFQSDQARRLDLSYHVEWSRIENGKPVFLRQAMDWSRIPEDREVLLLEVDKRWRLWAKAESPNRDSCGDAPEGGGLRATVLAERDGLRKSVTRRTSDGVTSALYLEVANAQTFHLQTLPRISEDGKTAEVDFEFGFDKARGTGTATVPLGREASLAPGLSLLLETVPRSDQALPGDEPVQDPETGWYRHTGRSLSFSYPPEWKVRESCSDSKTPTGWNLVNRSPPRDPLKAIHVFGFSLPPAEKPLVEEGEASLLEVDGGKCLVWRDETSDPLCGERCPAGLIARAECRADKEKGLRAAFNMDLGKEAGLETERFGKFLRFLKSFSL